VRPARNRLLAAIAAGLASLAAAGSAVAGEAIPNLVGTWSGKVDTISDLKGLVTRDRTITITEQTDRRFRGYFVYEAGRKDFFGVVFPDNASFAWVSSTSKGYNHGRILGDGRISACYIESGSEATAGCAALTRSDAKP
jgi:hypothetical protein